MSRNLLPCDGTAIFTPEFIDKAEAAGILTELQATIPWREERLTFFGKTYLSPRQVCWFGDHAYTYSGKQHEPTPWLPLLLDLKARVGRACGTPFNSVLANLYRDGRDSMGWHADDERGLGDTIASVSLGADRTFRLRHKRRSVPGFGLVLTDGSLLIMKDGMQHKWEHSISKTLKPTQARINLTFRHIQS